MFNFSGPTWEGIKEVARWVVLFLVSWLITETLKQVTAIPEIANVKVWVFVYTVPVRAGVVFLLTFTGRWVDKYLFEKSKDETKFAADKPKGLLPF